MRRTLATAAATNGTTTTLSAIREAQTAAGVGPTYPVAFRSVAAERWAGSGSWRPCSLVRQRSEPLAIKRSTRREFMYIESASKERLPDLDGGDLEVIELAAAEFFRACTAQAVPTTRNTSTADERERDGRGVGGAFYHYFTGPVAEAFPPLTESTSEWTEMVVDMEHWAAQGATPEQLGYLSVWIGGEGR